MHYYQFNIGDYTSHTRGLSLLEDLAYRRMIDEYFLAERPLNGCSTDVARIIGFAEHQQEVEYVLGRFFEHIDGVWVHERIEKDLKHFKDKAEKAAKAGKASAQARKSKELLTGDEQALSGRSTTVQPTNNQEPITNNHKPITKGTRLSIDSLPTEWAEFCRENRPDLNPKAVFDGFRDYWIAAPGQKGVKLDWLATWRNWVRSQKSGSNGQPAKRIPQPENFDEKDYGPGGLL